jgi:Cft2 family RNA processing exonuclease
MKFTNLTRQNEIGANCYYLQVNGSGVLLDCGSHPKVEGSEGLPRLGFLRDKPLDAVLMSHSHLDHIGALPITLSEHSRARAYMTHATRLIADRALHNSASVMLRQRAELKLPEYPLFTHHQVDRLVEDFEVVSYGRPFSIRDMEITYFEAGHVQGAAGVWIEVGGKSLFYTGDAKFADMKITRGAQFPEKRPDVMVIECTRGGVPQNPHGTWEEEAERLCLAIQETFERGGSVLIPCFALGKTQEILKTIDELIEKGKLAPQTIYISGLSRAYTEIYDELAQRHPRVCPGYRLEKSMDLEVLEMKAARVMEIGKGRLMLVSSGMMTPHTMSHHLAQRMLSDERHSILFVGYVDPDSMAGKIKAAGQGSSVDFGSDMGTKEIRCRINVFDFTSHCSRESMLDYVVRCHPEKVVLVHGEMSSIDWFSQEIQRRQPKIQTIIPPSGEVLSL